MNFLKISKIIFLPALAVSFLASCNGGGEPTDSSTEPIIIREPLKILSPQGAPALALYTEYENPDYVTRTDPKLVNAELQKNEFDIIVAPVFGAMKAIKNFNCDFGLARVLTGGNFYLVGVNKTAEDRPTADSYIVGFAETDVTGMSFKKLFSDHWHLGEGSNLHWVDNAQATLGILKSGKHMGNTVDYVLTAEPVFTNAKTQLDEGVSLVETYDIRKEWKDFSGQENMVQAGLFIRKSTLAKEQEKDQRVTRWFKNNIKAFMNRVELNIANALGTETISDVVAELSKHTIAEQKERFGYNANLVNALQSGGKNRFGLVSKDAEPDVNAFMTTLGVEAYPDSYFVTVD